MWAYVVGSIVSTPGGTGDITLGDIWPILVVMFTGAAGVFAFLVKKINDLDNRNDKLVAKLTDEVVPALTESTTASKSMVEATVRLQSALAVQEDRQKERRK